MIQISIISIGKNKDNSLLKLEENFLKRLKISKVNIVELKSSSPKEEWILIQEKILNSKKFKDAAIYFLDEKAKQYSSSELSKLIYSDNQCSQFAFIIGGAMGFPDVEKKSMKKSISISKFTFPHRLIRLILAEQIYRMESIHLGHPYHNE